jgi:LacI family transcriptional regulator
MSVDAGVPPVLGRVTITDVARAAGVSVATVSKVVNGRYGVAPATFERVMAVVTELGYETSLIAASLRRSKTNVIGVLVTEFESYSAELLKGIGAAAHGTGYELMAYAGLVEGMSRDGWERRSLSRLAGTLIDGAILVTPSVLMPETSVPVVAIDPHKGRGGPSTVDSDNVGGARAATDHLLSLGHRRIAHLRGRADLESSHRRELGYRTSLEAAGVEFDPALVRDGEYQRKEGYTAALELLARPDRPTAVFAANDLSALGAIAAAHELGLRVPHDVSVVGFDDIPDAGRSTPSLTTFAQPLHEMGAEAFRMLMDLLSGRESGLRHEHLVGSLVVRESTAPPSA